MEPCGRVRIYAEVIDEIADSVADTRMLKMSEVWNDHQIQQKM